MITYDETLEMLNEISAHFPNEFYKDLNGGIVLLDETKRHANSGPDSQLYILGQYHYQPNGLGRYISIYYGSFKQLYGNSPRKKQIAELKRILAHEFTHHIEHLAGDNSLEKKDERELIKYRMKKYDSNADLKPGNRQKAIRFKRRIGRDE